MHCYLRRRDLSGWIWNLALQTQEWLTRLTMGRNNCIEPSYHIESLISSKFLVEPQAKKRKSSRAIQNLCIPITFCLGQRRFMSIKSIYLLNSLKVFSSSCNYVQSFRTILVTLSFVTERVPILSTILDTRLVLEQNEGEG